MIVTLNCQHGIANMGLPKRLTEMQKRFAELLVFGGPDGPLTKSEAAKLAGYSEKRCRQEGSELTNPKAKSTCC